MEKPATLNAREAKFLFDLAKQKNLFLMEAVWTRFFPLSAKFKELLHKDKAIGDFHYVLSTFGMDFFHTSPVTHRVFDPKLGGSAQLDIGPYSLLWVSRGHLRPATKPDSYLQGLLALHEHPDNNREAPSKITASSLPDPRTGVDLFTSITLDFKKINSRADCARVCASTTTEVANVTHWHKAIATTWCRVASMPVSASWVQKGANTCLLR